MEPKMKNLKIRKATLKDLPTILKIQREMLEEMRGFMLGLDKKKNIASYPKSELKDILTSKNAYFVLAEVDGELIGSGFARIEKAQSSCAWIKYKKQGYLGQLYVRKGFRRKGIAKALQDERTKWLRRNGIKFCVNTVLTENKPSLKLQKTQGFKPYYIGLYKILK